MGSCPRLRRSGSSSVGPPRRARRAPDPAVTRRPRELLMVTRPPLNLDMSRGGHTDRPPAELSRWRSGSIPRPPRDPFRPLRVAAVHSGPRSPGQASGRRGRATRVPDREGSPAPLRSRTVSPEQPTAPELALHTPPIAYRPLELVVRGARSQDLHPLCKRGTGRERGRWTCRP